MTVQLSVFFNETTNKQCLERYHNDYDIVHILSIKSISVSSDIDRTITGRFLHKCDHGIASVL